MRSLKVRCEVLVRYIWKNSRMEWQMYKYVGEIKIDVSSRSLY